MKKWVSKLLEQFDIEVPKADQKDGANGTSSLSGEISEEIASILYIIDTYNKHLIEIDTQPVRKVREMLDEFAKGLVGKDSEKVLFRFRQFFSSYRIDEYTYIKKTFDDFKMIIWDFADQLSDEVKVEKTADAEIQDNFEQLKEAVESNSIEALRAKSREFIDSYVEHQSKKDERRAKRLSTMEKNLNLVKKQLTEANESMRVDHLTGAYNRKSFEEQMQKYVRLFELSKSPVSVIAVDIDFFKKINDTYGHDVGDWMLKECVRMLKTSFSREADFVARMGGEEFVVILPEMTLEQTLKIAEDTLNKIRKEVFVHGENQIRFTVSMGIAQLMPGESAEHVLKRADTALYQSKNTGRNRYTIASEQTTVTKVAS